MGSKDEFEISSVDELREKYGLYAENAPKITLDRTRIPDAVAPLIPYAEIWGISDDLMRDDLAEKAGSNAVAELRAAIRPFQDDLNEWLGGPESESSDPTAEYIAFTCMLMAAYGA